MTTSEYPDDMDTTSLTCTVLDHFTAEVKDEIMDEMLRYKNRDGIVQVYFTEDRSRFGEHNSISSKSFLRHYLTPLP